MKNATNHGLRPRLHVTAPVGWLNDPHGVCWLDGRYHLFYQAQPQERVWSPGIGWGHAEGTDLLGWTHRPTALVPTGDETGCWTGDVRVEDGVPVLYYTSPPAAHPGLARVARAVPDDALLAWRRERVVIDGPPADLGAHEFRDPCLVESPAGPRLLVGAGAGDGLALAVQYAPDGHGRWVETGPLAQRSSAEVDGTWTGAMWECPRLFAVGEDWVLLVSVWSVDALHYVAAAVGDYDGSTFTPRHWSRLTHDPYAYAMTSFRDRDGRPAVLSWLRERDDHDPDRRPWAGALSLPALVSIGPDGHVRLDPHPDLTARRAPDAAVHALAGTCALPDAVGVDAELPAGPDLGWQLRLTGGDGDVLTLTTAADALTVQVSDRPTWQLPVAASTVRIVVDVGVVEVFGGRGSGAIRIAETAALHLTVAGRGPGEVRLYRLTS